MQHEVVVPLFVVRRVLGNERQRTACLEAAVLHVRE
jgi:hypothetical protein